MMRRMWGFVVVVLVAAAAVSACTAGSTGAVRTVTQTVTATVSDSAAPPADDSSVAPAQEFVADEDAFYAAAIELDKSLADMPRETVTGYGWNICQIEATADMSDPMYKNMLGPAKARGTLEAAHTYLCPDNA